MGIKSCKICKHKWYGVTKKMREIGANFCQWYCTKSRKKIGSDEDLKNHETCEHFERGSFEWMK